MGDFGTTRGFAGLPDGLPIRGVAGDQQASLVGQGCWGPGTAKCTYGTGAFLLAHTGTTIVPSTAGLVTTLAAGLGDGPPEYALEGSVFIAGAAVQWLRDGLRAVGAAADLLGLPLRRSPQVESTALGAALLAGLGVGLWPDPAVPLTLIEGSCVPFHPRRDDAWREAAQARWRHAVATVRGHYAGLPGPGR